MELDIRLNILRDSEMLSEENYNKVLKVIDYFYKVKNIKLIEDNSSMFITHLCSALERIDKNEKLNDIESEVLESLKAEESYNSAICVINDLREVLGKIPKEEENFLVVHICTLLGQA